MEILTILGIGLGEVLRSIWIGKFDTLSFWMKCMKVNVIYAKFFQAIAVNYDLTTEIHSIPYTEDEICYPKDIPVKGIIGSGVISIVFEGELDGVPIVVKTKRKNIEERVNCTLQTIGRWIHRLDRLVSCPVLIQSYTEISENFKTQMDFVSEYNNQCLFIDIYKELPYVRIPTLYKELCNSEQLVMTKLTGISINDLTEEEKIQTTIWLSKLTLHSLMKYGYAHSDLHAGNMLFNRDHIGIIDFGFILKLNEEEKENFYHLLKEFAFDNLEKAAYHTIQMTAPIETCRQLSVDAIKDISKFIIHVYKNATIFHKFFSVYDILQINKKLRIYDLEISSTFYKLVVSLNSIEAVLENLSSSTIDLFIGAISDIEEY